MKPSTKFVVDMFKGHKKKVLVIVLVSTLGSLLAVIIPYLYGKLFDLATIPDTTVNLLLGLIGVWLVLNIVSTYISNKTSLMGEVLGSRVALEAEVGAYSHYITLPVEFHKKEQRGEVLQRISRGSWNLQRIIEIISDTLPQFLMLAFALIAMLLIQWQLAIVIVFSFILYASITFMLLEPILDLQKKEQKVFEKQYGNIYDKLYNVFLIKNFVKEGVERNAFFHSLLEKAYPMVEKTAKKSANLSIIQGVVYGISFVAVLGIAIFFFRAGKISAGEFIMFFGYINLAFGPFRHLDSIYRNYRRSSVAIKRHLKLRRIVPEAMSHGRKILNEVKGKIEFKGVSFAYRGRKDILKDIALKIKAGETVALVGKSGVGKTTLSELILGYYKTKRGKIFLDDVDISELELANYRDQIAVVPQEISLFNDSLINNLRYAAPKSSRQEIERASKEAFAHEFIKNLPNRYYTIVGDRGFKLSVGQKQRIALAMAFLKNPKILILDEPTSALDAKSEKFVQQGIRNLVKGRTTIIIAHRFSTVREADKIVVLSKGKVAEVGNHKELMKKRGIYYNLYSLQKGLD